MMKDILLVLFATSTLAISAQSSSLSTFEEMWIVASSFKNVDKPSTISLAPESMTYEKIQTTKSFTDLNKIIADTPFLSMKLGKAGDKHIQNSKGGTTPTIHLSERYGPSKGLNGEAEWVALVDDGENIWLSIKTSEPVRLKTFIEKNNFLITDEKGKFNQMSILDIRIENGTYSKTK